MSTTSASVVPPIKKVFFGLSAFILITLIVGCLGWLTKELDIAKKDGAQLQESLDAALKQNEQLKLIYTSKELGYIKDLDRCSQELEVSKFKKIKR